MLIINLELVPIYTIVILTTIALQVKFVRNCYCSDSDKQKQGLLNYSKPFLRKS
ncbi:MAG: hypothetical protein BWY68_00624 [bacterium ADurb.Bin400]|nr:MAG: hypothetical protein BWY68_00624 [bacterium ADurb.Bin400]